MQSLTHNCVRNKSPDKRARLLSTKKMIRPSIPTDLPQIKALLDAAFAPSTFESSLVDCVFHSAEEYHGWTAETNARLTGFVLYTLALRKAETVGYHLAPVAVHPDFQRQGIGTKLITSTLNAVPISSSPVFVLGDPAYYERFGFQAVRSPACPYDPSDEHFRALRWMEPQNHFTIGYSDSFQIAE